MIFQHPLFLLGASSLGLGMSVYGGLASDSGLLGYAFVFAFMVGWALALVKRGQQ